MVFFQLTFVHTSKNSIIITTYKHNFRHYTIHSVKESKLLHNNIFCNCVCVLATYKKMQNEPLYNSHWLWCKKGVTFYISIFKSYCYVHWSLSVSLSLCLPIVCIVVFMEAIHIMRNALCWTETLQLITI